MGRDQVLSGWTMLNVKAPRPEFRTVSMMLGEQTTVTTQRMPPLTAYPPEVG